MCVNNNFSHGIMFHHFHDDKVHKKSQGSINIDEFYKIINFIGKISILDANIFYEKLKENKLKDNDICLTFDDGIKSQIDICLPVLEDLKIKSFFFIQGSILTDTNSINNTNSMELFRYFRMHYFNNIEDFYNKFYLYLGRDLDKFFDKNMQNIKNIKKTKPYYSFEDIKFRLVRDLYLTKEEYEENYYLMIKESNININEIIKNLFFSKKDTMQLLDLGHTVGAHSFSHPYLIEKFSYNAQKTEYEESLNSLSTTLKKPKHIFKTMSHPCGSYNNDTLKILKILGFELIIQI